MKKTWVLIKHLYIAEMYLKYGNSPFCSPGRHLPANVTEFYVDRLHLEYSKTRKKYLGDEDEIWDYFIGKYQTKLNKLHITSYDQLLYTALK